MINNEEIEAIIVKHFPPPPQPSDAMDSEVEWERQHAREVVRDVLKLIYDRVLQTKPVF